MAAPSIMMLAYFLLSSCIFVQFSAADVLPLVINTWPFTGATAKAWQTIGVEGKSALDAVVSGCKECEKSQCDGTVGYGGSPDEIGETTLDAMIMDGKTHDVGSVGDLRRVKNAIDVARAVMEYTEHTLIVGESASNFAVEMGFTEESLQTNRSREIWENWKAANCQPNYRQNVSPDPKKSCGPYKPQMMSRHLKSRFPRNPIGPKNHDTIGMVVVDKQGNVVSGTSTNGVNHKVPGRVGDSPIVGAGSYASNGKGGAAATGDGDIMMRFLPSFAAVMLMGQGMPPSEAAAQALKPIIQSYPSFSGALVAANINGSFGAACHGLSSDFRFSVRNSNMKNVTVMSVPCI